MFFYQIGSERLILHKYHLNFISVVTAIALTKQIILSTTELLLWAVTQQS